MTEPEIRVNEQLIGPGCSMAVRVAITNLADVRLVILPEVCQ